ncbi:hypothetical protein EV361DRAFT_1038127 [Lentinula raphanica]|nr:hypothetical protein EV361DRAFT_1038127 [Lentinula raphanica]
MPSLPTPSPALPAMRHTRSCTVTPTSSLSFNSASSSFCSQLFSNEIENLRHENALLQVQAHLAEDNDRIAEQCNAAEAHAILIGQQYSIANYRLNQKKKKNDASKRVSTSARILTSAEAQQEFAEAAARKAEEQRATEDLKQQQKDEQNRADILRRAEQELAQATFSGSLKSLNKSTLIDIAFALKVEYNGASAGTLCVRLNAHFDANEDLKQDPHFIGLFQWKRKRKDLPKENEDSESSLLPPTHCRRTKNHCSPTPGPSSISNSDPSRSPIHHFVSTKPFLSIAEPTPSWRLFGVSDHQNNDKEEKKTMRRRRQRAGEDNDNENTTTTRTRRQREEGGGGGDENNEPTTTTTSRQQQQRADNDNNTDERTRTTMEYTTITSGQQTVMTGAQQRQ